MERQSFLCLTDSSSSDSPLHSCTLHTTQSVTDMDKKMKAIITALEEDGQYQNRKLEIKCMLEEYNRSYQSLAEKYDYLKFIFVNILSSGSSTPSDTEIFRCNIKCPGLKSVSVNGSLKCNNDILDKEFLIKLRDELVSSKQCNQNSDEIVEARDEKMYGRIAARAETDDTELKMNKFELQRVKDVHPSVAIAQWESTWNDLNSQVTVLMEENLQHQEELTRRNNEKREAIKELHQQIKCLKSENRALHSSLRFTKERSKPYRSPISRLAETISNKLFGAGLFLI